MTTSLTNVSVAKARLPVTYEAARTALEKCEQIDECKGWADKAAAIASYAKQSDDKTLERTALKIRARAIRRCGELLKQIEAAAGRPPKDQEEKKKAPDHLNSFPTRSEAAREAGLSEHQQKTAVRVASVPEPAFERAISRDKPATVTELAERGTKPRPKPPPTDHLRGLSPADHAAATQVQAGLRRFAAMTAQADVAVAVRGSHRSERKEMGAHAATIGVWLRQLTKALERVN